MTAQTDADDALRDALVAWCRAHEVGKYEGVLGDVVAVAHFRLWGDDGSHVDDYVVATPAGVSHHAAVGLLAEAHFLSEVSGDDD